MSGRRTEVNKGRHSLLGVDALEQCASRIAPDVDYGHRILATQELVVSRRVVAAIRDNGGWVEPGVQALRLGEYRRQLRGVVSTSSGDDVGERQPVVDVGNHMYLVAVPPLLAASLGLGAVFRRPGRLRVADGLTAGRAVAPNCGRVHRRLLAQVWQQRLYLARELGKAQLHEV